MKIKFSIEELEKMEKNPWLTDRLTDRERKVFDLYYRRGWKIEDVAAEIEMQRSAVERSLKSIRNKCRKML